MNATSPQHVLIVEDDEGVAYLQHRMLQRAGYEVSVASSAEEALAFVLEGGLDLVVLDYGLPGELTGLEFHAQLKASGHDIPVVMVTGYSDGSTVIKALRQGVRDFVPKSAEYLDYLPEAVGRVLKQVQTEKQLVESEARFQSFMENSPLVAFIKDDTGRYMYANRRFETAFARSDWQGLDDFAMFPDSAAALRQNDRSVLDNNQPTELLETVPLADGDERQWISHKFPIEDARGRRFLGGVALDVTERRRAEEALRQRDEQLRQSQKMEAIGGLAGGVAHEFNNLLQAMQGYTEFAQQELPAGSQPHRDLQHVLKAIDRAAGLTRQLLGFGRRQMLEFRDLDPNVIVEDLVAMLRPLIGEHIALSLTLDPAVGTAYADAGHFQQLLMNLCLNARDAMPSGGQLSVSTKHLELSEPSHAAPAELASGQYLVLRVADTGGGMTPEVKQHIFEPFFTTKPIGKGTGLGLAMVYGAVKQHQGTIRVDSELNVGTTFTIYLPTSSRPPAAAPVAAALPTTGRETILIAEDDAMVREIAVRILRSAGYTTLEAEDGTEAVRMFADHQHSIHLTMLDVVMPREGGHAAFEQIRAIRPDARVVFCSAYDPDAAQLGFVARHGLRLVEKPYEPQVLLRTVREALDAVAVAVPLPALDFSELLTLPAESVL